MALTTPSPLLSNKFTKLTKFGRYAGSLKENEESSLVTTDDK